MKLRPYQERLIDETREKLRRHQRVLMQAPTGAGKTAITVYMMGRAAEAGKRSVFCVHQNELLSQTSKALWQQKLEHGMIAAGKRLSKLPAQVASVQTWVRRTDQYPEPDLIIIDECHRSASTTYQKILEAYPNAKVIGLTATPQRTDGKGLDGTYSAIVQGPSIRQLIDAGYLSDYEIFAPPSTVDLSAVKTRMGDYDKRELEQTMDKPTITGDAVATYKKHAYGKRCVVMCVSIRHAEHVMESYRAAGVPAEMIEGSMTNPEREAVLNRFRRGETLVITNVQLLIEGVDIPSIEVVQWLRPTQSLIIWMQGNGRGLRPSDSKDRLLILDQVGNWARPGFGLPDEDREWSLEGRKKRKRKTDDEADVNVQQCKHCFHIFRPGPSVCPSCGKPVEVRKKAEIQVVDGELERIDIEAEKRQRKRNQGAARNLQDLIQLGVRRGMKNPSGWAVHVHCAREGRKPTASDYQQAKRLLAEVRAA
jgi:superfamily II DNA or RNA helicase